MGVPGASFALGLPMWSVHLGIATTCSGGSRAHPSISAQTADNAQSRRSRTARKHPTLRDSTRGSATPGRKIAVASGEQIENASHLLFLKPFKISR